MKRQQETRVAITQEDHDARQKRRQAVPPPAARDGGLAPAPACCLLPAGGKQRLSGLRGGRIPVSGPGPGWTTGCAAGAPNAYYTVMEARCFDGDLNFLQEEKKLDKKHLIIAALYILSMFAIWIVSSKLRL